MRSGTKQRRGRPVWIKKLARRNRRHVFVGNKMRNDNQTMAEACEAWGTAVDQEKTRCRAEAKRHNRQVKVSLNAELERVGVSDLASGPWQAGDDTFPLAVSKLDEAGYHSTPNFVVSKARSWASTGKRVMEKQGYAANRMPVARTCLNEWPRCKTKIGNAKVDAALELVAVLKMVILRTSPTQTMIGFVGVSSGALRFAQCINFVNKPFQAEFAWHHKPDQDNDDTPFELIVSNLVDSNGVLQVKSETELALELLAIDDDWQVRNVTYTIGSSIASVLVTKQTLINVEEEKAAVAAKRRTEAALRALRKVQQGACAQPRQRKQKPQQGPRTRKRQRREVEEERCYVC